MTAEDILSAVGLPADTVARFAPHTQVLESDALATELKALHLKNEVGKPAVVVYRGPHALLVNWHKVVLEAIPAGIGGGAALAAGEVIGGIAGLAGAFAILIGAADLELGDDHGKAVLALWVAHPDTNPVRREALTATLPGLAVDRLDRILRDLARLRVIGFGDDGAVIKRDELILQPGG